MHSVKGKRSTQEDAHIVLVKPSARAGPAALPTLSNSQGSSVGKLRPLSNGAVEEPASRARKGSLLERFVRARDASKVSPVPVPPPRPVHQPAAHYDLVAIFDGHGGARGALHDCARSLGFTLTVRSGRFLCGPSATHA